MQWKRGVVFYRNSGFLPESPIRTTKRRRLLEDPVKQVSAVREYAENHNKSLAATLGANSASSQGALVAALLNATRAGTM